MTGHLNRARLSPPGSPWPTAWRRRRTAWRPRSSSSRWDHHLQLAADAFGDRRAVDDLDDVAGDAVGQVAGRLGRSHHCVPGDGAEVGKPRLGDGRNVGKAGERAVPPLAMILISPEVCSGSEVVSRSNSTSTWPPTKSLMAGASPRTARSPGGCRRGSRAASRRDVRSCRRRATHR